MWILSLVSMVADVASEMLYPVVPVYLKEIGFSVFLIGLLEGIAEAVSGLSKGYFGSWSDRYGERMPFVRWGYALSALSKPLFVILQLPLWVVFVRTLDRIGKGLRTAPRDALLSAAAPVHMKARIFNFHRGWDTFGAVLGPAIALLYLHFYPGKYAPMFYIAFLPGIIAVFLTYLIREKSFKPIASKLPFNIFSFFKYWKKASFQYKRIFFLLILFALFNSSDMLLLLKVNEVTGNGLMVLVIYIFYNIIYAASSYPFGILADKVGMKVMLLAGLLLFSVTYWGMAFNEINVSFYLLFGLYGLYMAATEGISKAWITSLVKQEETGTAVGLFVAVQSIALMVASAFAGFVWSFYGATVTFLLTASVSCLVFVLTIFFVRKPVL